MMQLPRIISQGTIELFVSSIPAPTRNKSQIRYRIVRLLLKSDTTASASNLEPQSTASDKTSTPNMSTNTASINAGQGAGNTYQNPNINPSTSQGVGAGAGSMNLGQQRLGGDSTNPDGASRGTTTQNSTSATQLGSSLGQEASGTGAAATSGVGANSSTVGGGDAPTSRTGGIAGQIKGAFAQGHGVGEILRGKVNSAVDTMAGDSQGMAIDKRTTTAGEREYANKEFAKKTSTD
ncbi:hypothetical protein MCOR27_007102 [Pyricularia oryzae]|uniref:CsbD-like domain-containing protein n=2 Tax=Pyricularia TaxID=48558 RepID=A0ABQ8NA46_PYRGI|nr:hypothetical protein MCOR01_002729 [Pyricularia oryzae]KAI6293755.1 hypothetical protein MCOR33_008911 [Pyricularia grisea]KAH9433008.1 hypothetical protein MCOR02_007680 [Pyricularia oryzae]KAI6258791.1 hypothetical protein MCOR19_004811 [Pyricularia oryzae]KAI6275147.1 hypothetical protein MCOR27_007102 [Pyricularia oryzae]